ncbi:hypothetical protein Tco_0052082 [Tanacetum coccineum]
MEHSVAKLLFENEKLHKEKEHLKKTYKELYDSIKPTRVRAKEQCDALIVNLNSKSMENANLKTQIQQKVFANAALKTELRKLKEKKVINTVVSKPLATTIAPGMYELELEHLPPKVLKNVDAQIAYIKHSRDHADTLRDISMLNANSKSVCAICNECLFDANRDKCVLDYVHDVNVLSKSKRAKRRTFTIVRNKCPLTWFTSTKVVPLKETTIKSVLTPTQGIKVYSKRSKAPKSVEVVTPGWLLYLPILKDSFEPEETLPLLPITTSIFYESESSKSESKDVGEIDIETLTLEQYLALNLNNTRRRISNPVGDTFEIKGQFLRELRKTTFLGSLTENEIEHIEKVLEVASLFNANDSALLRVFPLTLVGVAKTWFDVTSPEHAKNWDELK